MNEKVDEASAALRDVYTTFGKNLVLPQPFYYETTILLVCDGNHNEELYAPYWYHPDHLFKLYY